jgi:shikimate kinase
MPRITLIGYRGTGKSTIAALLADRLHCGWTDADEALEGRHGCTIASLVRDRGELAFRAAEADMLAELLARSDGVLATGGGVVLRPGNRELLHRFGRPIVWLTASADVVRRRLAADPATATRRPGLTGADPLAEVAVALATREPLYRECADLTVDTAAADPETIVDSIVAWLDGRDAGGERRPVAEA